MLTQKRLPWLVVSLLLITLGITFVITRKTSGEAKIQQTRQSTRTRILRPDDRVSLKPTKQEVLGDQAAPQLERLLENKIPEHIPIKIKIKKEKEKQFKDLKNEKWARDFELEVTNTGTKPIYELYLLLITDVRAAEGYRILAPLYYGRSELGTISTLATPEDVPIKPGESVTLKIHSGQLGAWDIKRKEEDRPLPKKIQIELQGLSFGDGTGYVGSGGQAVPRNAQERSQLDRCVNPRNKVTQRVKSGSDWVLAKTHLVMT